MRYSRLMWHSPYLDAGQRYGLEMFGEPSICCFDSHLITREILARLRRSRDEPRTQASVLWENLFREIVWRDRLHRQIQNLPGLAYYMKAAGWERCDAIGRRCFELVMEMPAADETTKPAASRPRLFFSYSAGDEKTARLVQLMREYQSDTP